jgi:hypothetical protein
MVSNDVFTLAIHRQNQQSLPMVRCVFRENNCPVVEPHFKNRHASSFGFCGDKSIPGAAVAVSGSHFDWFQGRFSNTLHAFIE